MTRFTGLIKDAFDLPTRDGIALMLTHIEGTPEVGMQVIVGGKVCSVLALGRNSTDGQIVSTRDCLTGKTVPAYGSILVAKCMGSEDLADLHLTRITEAAHT